MAEVLDAYDTAATTQLLEVVLIFVLLLLIITPDPLEFILASHSLMQLINYAARQFHMKRR